MKKFKGLKSVLVALFIGILLVGVFYRFSNKKVISSEEEPVPMASAVDVALDRNLTANYPQTPKEVVKYFSEITQCFYNETFEDDEEFEALADQMLKLYDDELVSYKTHQDYLFDLESDIKYYNENGYKISSYSPSASTDVFYFTEDGFDWARLYCVYTIKSGKYYKTLNEVFVLRKDENNHWKIYGWDEVIDE